MKRKTSSVGVDRDKTAQVLSLMKTKSNRPGKLKSQPTVVDSSAESPTLKRKTSESFRQYYEAVTGVGEAVNQPPEQDPIYNPTADKDDEDYGIVYEVSEGQDFDYLDERDLEGAAQKQRVELEE